jgi:hypothetical protein
MEPLDPTLLNSIAEATHRVDAIADGRALSVFLYSAAAFFFGVLVSLILSLVYAGKDAPRPLPLALTRFMVGVLVFFVTSPAQAYVLTTNWAESALTPFDWLREMLRGSGALQLQAFAYGLIMLLGAISFDLFRMLRTLVLAILGRVLQPPGP